MLTLRGSSPVLYRVVTGILDDSEYGLMDFVCRHLKKNNQIAETWFFNGRLWVKVDDFGKKRQVSHIEDLYDLFGAEEIANLIRSNRRY